MGEYGTLVSLVFGAVGILIGAAATAYVKISQQKHSEKKEDQAASFEQQKYEDMQAKAAYDLLISNLTSSMQAVVAELKASQQDHIKCVEAQAVLRGQVDQLLREVESLRNWRHDLANVAHKEAMKNLEESKTMELATAAATAAVTEKAG